jgi:hypothetical protein
MRKKLKTLEKIKKEFKHYYGSDGSINIYGVSHYIHKNMFKYFGKEIEVEKVVYNYRLKKDEKDKWKNWAFLDNWFEDEENKDFIEENEFMI